VLSRRRPSDRFTYGLRSASILAALANAIITLVTAAVVVAGVGIWLTGWLWLDPATSLFVSAVIVIGTWGLVKSAIGLALNAVPEGVDPAAVRALLRDIPGVIGLHDLHIWGMSTTETALTCHLVIPSGHPGDALFNDIAQQLHRRFGIHHATIQIELADTDEVCVLTTEHVV
jgi:cobalt-zinc-cadmium efflux system protein